MTAASAVPSSRYYRRQSLPPSTLSHRCHHVAQTSYLSMAHCTYLNQRERAKDRKGSDYKKENVHGIARNGMNTPDLHSSNSYNRDSGNTFSKRYSTRYGESCYTSTDRDILLKKKDELKKFTTNYTSPDITSPRSNKYLSRTRTCQPPYQLTNCYKDNSSDEYVKG